MTKRKLDFSIEFPDDDKKKHSQTKKHYDIHEYSSDEVNEMRQQAESIIKLTKAMGINANDDQVSTKSQSEVSDTTEESSAIPRTREQFRASKKASSHHKN